jgi:hypothetical protein
MMRTVIYIAARRTGIKSSTTSGVTLAKALLPNGGIDHSVQRAADSIPSTAFGVQVEFKAKSKW